MPKFQKFGVGIMLSVFVFITIGGFVVSAEPSHAQLATIDVSANTARIIDKIQTGLKNAAIGIAVQSFSYFLRRVSYDSAVWLASGGKGQTPFAHYKDFNGYIADVGDHVAGVAIDALGAPYGLNLCKIPDPKIDLAMRIGLTYKFMDLNQQQGVLQPNCTWSSFQTDVLSASNWQSQYGSAGDVARKFNVAFSVEQSDLGILMSATEKIDNLVARQTDAAKLQRQEGNGYKAKTTPISGDIVTPAKNIAEEAQSQNPSAQRKSAEAGFLATLGTGAVGSITGAASLFINTLASQMLRNYQTKGMFPFGVCVGDSGGEECRSKLQDTLSNLEGQVSRGGRQAAEALFADLLTPPNIQIDQYNVLVNFSNCPATSPGPENCVADSSLTQAAQEANSGKPVTIKEALAKNWLHGEWKLISPERSADQTDMGCYQRAYCYANIAKLRKARVLPLGFEIAALNSNPDQPWTLKQVVDGFNDCNFIKDLNGNVVGVDNDPVNKPFCHLIDQNWVLKAPPSKCNFVAFGSTPYFSGTPNRATECADLSTCVAYDKDGNCANQGYCTRERNVWKIDAAKCDAQYRTCQSFQDSTGKNVSYLYRTLDTGYCTQDNVGCAQFSLKQDASGNWADYSKNELSILGENSAIFFNNKISTNCSANSDGCSSFQTASTSDKLYLRQAPYYLGCYDTNTGTLAIDRPQTASDLNKLTDNPKCNNYSASCIADEVNCNWYAPISYSGDSIPGKFTPATIVENQVVWNDQCDKRCVGYSAYREMASNYSAGQALAYIIPSSGSKCNAVDEGCSSFTNLSADVGGLEKVEHYSYLRPCILPDPAKQKNFYTYEGSVVGGYQLKGFVLQKNADGSPKYFYSTIADLTTYDSVCSESLYKSGLASPDCRQFNDDQGAIYYKLLSKTIAVSGSCTPYRLNNTELIAPETCFQNGEYRDGQCFYYGLPNGLQNTAGASKGCAPEVNTCRAYKGNAGNNVRNIFTDNFEGLATNALADWGPSAVITQSLESTHAGEHSLSYNGPTAVYKDLSLSLGRSYDLTFWAKGSAGATVEVTLNNGTASTLGTVSVSDVWQSYHLGPVELNGASTSTQLRFVINGQLFLDNVHLKEVADYIYLVKNTLKVDPVCDSNLNDNLPGEALGCSEYRTPNNRPIYLTKFTALCREKAIGCTSLYDTRNTPNEPGPRAYNVWLAGPEGTQVTKNIGGNDYTCQVPVGLSGCYVNTIGATLSAITAGGGNVVTSTIYVQPDTVSSTPIYLVANQQASCNPVDLGCTQAGKLTQTPAGQTYTDVLVKKDPASYGSTLCQSQAVGCNAYSNVNGSLYFKDPANIGQKICAYKKDVTIGGTKYNGWFWKGVGNCSTTGQFCFGENDCASSGGTCNGVDEQPCYPGYLQSGNNYGIWSYGVSASYNNFVGECPQAQSGCTEFVDHNENNKTYYLINDDRMKKAQSDCNGQVSEKAGCSLFDKTDAPNKLWNTALSYRASAQLNNELVAPVASSTANNANIILKVDRDRECGEWLQCRSSHRIFDSQTGNYKEICDDIGRCNKSPESASQSDITNCANWVVSSELSNQILSDDAYRSRNTDWTGQEFSGYSILNYFPPEELSEVNFGNFTNPQWRLAKKVPCGGASGVNCKVGSNTGDTACRTSGNPCGRGNAGICVNQICVSNPDGSTANVSGQSIGQSCRAYPEETSPFPNTEAVGKSSLYASTNLCNETIGYTIDKLKAMGCDCDYTKVTYGDVFTKYWNFDKPNAEGIPDKNSTKTKPSLAKGIVSGLCSGGASDGRACGVDEDCTGGSCQKLKKQSRLVGWHGYCLEPDISRPLNAEPNNFACLTWFPIDTIMGVPDINNQHVEAGFQASSAGGKYYCLGAKGNQQQYSVSPAKYDYNQLLGTRIIAHDTIKVCSNASIATYCSTNQQCGCAAGETNANCLTANKACILSTSGGGNRERRKIDGLAAQNIYLDEIDYIKIVAENGGNWFKNGAFYIRNGLITKYNGSAWSVVGKEFPAPQQLKDEIIGLGISRYAISDGTSQSQDAEWIIRYDDGEGDGGDNAQFGDKTGMDVISEIGFRDLLIGPSSETGVDAADCSAVEDIDTVENVHTTGGTDNMAPCFGDHDDRDDGCAIRVKFSGGKLDRVNLVCYTDDNNDTEFTRLKVYAGLREPCTFIAQTEAVPYGATGWTDRLWRNAKYVANSTTDYAAGLNYVYDLLNQPFGSLGMNSLAPNSLVNIFTHYNETTFNPPPAIVGSPYSCGGPDPNVLNCLDTRIDTTTPENVNGPASGRPLGNGKLNLGIIFAKIDSVWVWNAGNYVQNTTTQFYQNDKGVPYNRTESDNGVITNAPKIHPLGTCKNSSKCLETDTPGFTVNGKSSGNVIFPNSVASVNIKFFASADKNQMPIKKMQVDWGDGTNVSLDGYFRNKRGAVNGLCGGTGSANTCFVGDINTKQSCTSNNDCRYLDNCFAENIAPNFGQIADKTCDNGFQRFDHVYQCVRDGAGWKAGTACSDEQTRNLNGGCCEFQPKVQVKDNWGWCNGSCPGEPGGTGCYEKDWGILADWRIECSQTNDLTKSPWTKFDNGLSNIIIAPQ